MSKVQGPKSKAGNRSRFNVRSRSATADLDAAGSEADFRLWTLDFGRYFGLWTLFRLWLWLWLFFPTAFVFTFVAHPFL